MPTIKICSCCGAYAGAFEQWHNRDTGYGLCGKCAKWILKESWAVSLDCNPEDIQITETRVVSPEEYQAAIQKHFQFGNTQ